MNEDAKVHCHTHLAEFPTIQTSFVNCLEPSPFSSEKHLQQQGSASQPYEARNKDDVALVAHAY